MIERGEAMAAVAEAGTRFVALVRSLSAEETAAQVPWMEWTVGDVAAHLVTIVRRTYADPRRSSRPDETAELNAQGLSEVNDRDPQRMADQIAEGLEIALERSWPKIPDGVRVPFHAGTRITIPGAAGVVLGEFLFHGFDIATTLGRPWPVSRREAALALWGLSEVIHGWMAPDAAELTETFEVRLVGEDRPMVFEFGGGQLRVTAQARRQPDHIVAAEPYAFALAVAYKRVPVVELTLARLSSLLLPA